MHPSRPPFITFLCCHRYWHYNTYWCWYTIIFRADLHQYTALDLILPSPLIFAWMLPISNVWPQISVLHRIRVLGSGPHTAHTIFQGVPLLSGMTTWLTVWTKLYSMGWSGFPSCLSTDRGVFQMKSWNIHSKNNSPTTPEKMANILLACSILKLYKGIITEISFGFD